MRCVLVSCCGLPAAGKTTFCRSIAASNRFPTQGATDTATDTRVERDSSDCGPIINGGPQIWVSHVCFDEYINSAHRPRRQHSRSSNDDEPSFNARISSHLSPASDVHHKKDQGAGVESGEKAELNLGRQAGADERDMKESTTYPQTHEATGTYAVESQGATETTPHTSLAEPPGASEGGEDGARWWHDGRRAAMAELEALAKGAESGARAGPKTAVISGGTVSSACAMPPAMLSEEMREDGCGYAQVFFPTDVEIAVKRNTARGTSVSEAVIRKMAANIQPPDPKRFKWERHTVVVSSPSGSRSPQEGTEMVPPLKPHRTPPDTANLYRNPPRGSSRAKILSPSGGDFDAGDNVSKVAEGSTTVVHSQRRFWCVIATAAGEDPKPLASDSASRVLDKEADREATKASVMHQYDLHLREAVKRVAEAAAGAGLSRDVHRVVMKACSASRKHAIRRARSTADQRSVSTSNQSTAGNVAVCHDSYQGCTAGGGDGCPTSGSLSDTDPFAREFENALGTIDVAESVKVQLVVAAEGVARNSFRLF
ncbi:unnamed protein product [Ectocarpus sp. CCAP 1310/34]|nr:unnamed protein product [Ectocarpus sp. CCAP 1310/34]